MINKPIGGFFGLEHKTDQEHHYHRQYPLLSSGRACLRYILEFLDCKKIYLPFFICDSVIDVLDLCKIEHVFYHINIEFSPSVTPELKDNEYFLYVNYYGINQENVNTLVKRYKDHLIIDNTHAFFETLGGNCPAFNSARKFFGVPDGGYLNISVENYEKLPLNIEACTDHLINKNNGLQEVAFKQYRKAEQAITNDIRRSAPLSHELLANIDYKSVRIKRRDNFNELNDAIGKYNQLKITLAQNAVPYCYPFLPSTPLQRELLLSRLIYFPLLWPEVLERVSSEDYQTERLLADRVLCLPIDQRYGNNEMESIADVILKLLP